MKKRFFKLTVPSDMFFIQKTIDKTLSLIENCYTGITQEDIYDLKLIFSEIFCNAILHGNKEDWEKRIYMELELDEFGVITSKIADEGSGYNYNELLNEIGITTAKGEFSMSDHGRGILLIKSLCDSLSFNANGNEIIFSKKVALNNVQHYNC